MPLDQKRATSPLHDPKCMFEMCVCVCVCIVNLFQIVLTYALCVYYETDACVCVWIAMACVAGVCVFRSVRCMVWLCIFGIWGQVFRPCWWREQMWFVLDSEFSGCRFFFFFLFLTFFFTFLFVFQVIALFLFFFQHIFFLSSPSFCCFAEEELYCLWKPLMCCVITLGYGFLH